MARTQNSIRNVLSAMVGQLGGILVNLLARVFFLHYLNQTYLGLNGLFTNVLTMLSLVELGVGPAMAYSLYKPLADHDIEKLKSHMGFYKKAYITIGPLPRWVCCFCPSIRYLWTRCRIFPI